MLRHSSLDDIEYSKYSHSTRKSIQNRQRRHHHSSHSKHHRIRNRKRNKNKHNNFAIDTCAVCLDESHLSDTKLFPCGHSFHGQCLIQWVTMTKGRKFNCPLCRQDIAHFIQMTGNQQLNEQLIQIWNEHYIYNSPSLSPGIDEDDEREKDIADKQIDHDITSKPSQTTQSPDYETLKCTKCPTSTSTSITEEVSVILSIKKEDETTRSTTKDIALSSNVNVNVEQVEIEIPQNNEKVNIDYDATSKIEFDVIQKSENRSIWKFIWKSPISFLYQQTNAYIKQCMLNDNLISPSNIAYNDVDNGSRSHSNHYHPDFDAFPKHQHQYRRKNEQEEVEHEPVTITMDKTHEPVISTTNNDNPSPNLLNFSILNVKSGILAGLFAGSTTFLMAQQIRHELLNQGAKGVMNGSIRNSFIPIMSETVPSVAVYFTSYEHLKRYLFDIDNINNPNYVTFSQRFVSAGIASSIAYYLPHKIAGNVAPHSGKGLLPFRFATFFGTFELSKDIMNKKHEQLNLFQVASCAAIGGTISHGLYYPLTQFNRNMFLTLDIIPPSGNGIVNGLSINGTATARILYRGWVSSLYKFLPSCVVCSCAFEYSKRYFSE